MTKFQILVEDKSAPGMWLPLGTEEGHSAAQAATKAYLKKPDTGTLSIVAVPVRSWKPTPIRTETVTKVVLGEDPQKITGAIIGPAELDKA